MSRLQYTMYVSCEKKIPKQHKNSENRMCRLAKQMSNKANLSNLYPRRRVILKTYKAQT